MNTEAEYVTLSQVLNSLCMRIRSLQDFMEKTKVTAYTDDEVCDRMEGMIEDLQIALSKFKASL